MTTGVILAAGAGSRLGEIGRRHSKAMLPVGGRPLIAWVIERLEAAGVSCLVVVGHRSDEPLARFLHERHPAALLVRQDERRGIAAALRLALPSAPPGEAYVACACDSIFDAADIAALVDLGQANPGAAVLGVLEMGRAATAERSAVRVAADRVVEIAEKPPPGAIDSGLVSVPLYWLPPDFAPYLDAPQATGEHYVSTAVAAFVAAGGTALALPVRRRLEITTADDIARVEAELA